MDEEIFPLEDVIACAEDAGLQAENRAEDLDPLTRECLADHDRLARKRGVPEGARWIFFRSPDWTWHRLCGREGYLLFDAETGTQHTFFLTTMN